MIEARAALLPICLLSACLHDDVQLFPLASGPVGLDAALDAGQSPGRTTRSGTCGGKSYQAEGKALEILLLVDNSYSALFPTGLDCLLGATDPRCLFAWNVSLAELQRFVNDPLSSGISVALKYFGTSCDPLEYQTPDVAMGRLPEHAPVIIQNLQATFPANETATRPALEGALAYARQRVQSPGYNARMIIVLLADDGPDETDCTDNGVAALARVAASGRAVEPPIDTYVFTTTGVSLESVAKAGGTERTIPVTLATEGQLAASLQRVRDQELAGLPCEYMIPPEYYQRVNDPALVNLRRDGVPQGRVSDASACDPLLGGWYYDDPQKPKHILTCESTCAALRRGGTVDIQLECPTVVLY